MSTLLPTAEIAGYLRQIQKFPLLEAAEEALLARRWRERADKQAVQKIVTSHLRLVPPVARAYRGYGLPLSELVSEGNIGLMQAVQRFDPEKGARFSTYAVWWIKAAIQEYIMRSWSLVKIGTTKSQRTLFFKLRQMKNRIAALQDGDMHPGQATLIAENLDVSERDVVEMDRRLHGDISLNAPVREGDQIDEWQDRLEDDRPTQEKLLADNDELDHRRRVLREALTTLSDRERHVFEMRRLTDEQMSLEELAMKLKLSRERVRQIEASAFEKICRAVRRMRGLTASSEQKVATTQVPEPRTVRPSLFTAVEMGA
jgi:RNA polymerase sigma-32 factor